MLKMGRLFFLCCFIIGCSSVTIPHYIKDDNPYKKTVYSSYDQVYEAMQDVLNDFGWSIANKVNPQDYEQDKTLDNVDGQQVLIFTQPRQNKLTLGFQDMRVNVYLREGKGNSTEVEVRYQASTTLRFKHFYDYKNDDLIDRMFQSLEERLQ